MEQNQMLLLQQLVIVQQGVSDEYEPKTLIQISKRAAGIEPASSAWKAQPFLAQSHCGATGLKIEKGACEMFGEMLCSESSLRAKNVKKHI
jgi:hypothetical protein